MSTLRNMACQPLSSRSPSLTDLETRVSNLSLEEAESMKVNLTKEPFIAVTSTLSFYPHLAGMAEDKLTYILYFMHLPLQKHVEPYLSPSQLVFSYWYCFTITEKNIDPHLALFQNLCHLASKVLNDDHSSVCFTPDIPVLNWVDALQAKLAQAKNFTETLDAFRDSKELIQTDTALPSSCPLHLWHNVCHLLIKAIPTLQDHQDMAFTALLSLSSPESIVRASLGLKYLFEPPANTPISFDIWANAQEAHAFSLGGLLERTLCEKTAFRTLAAIETMLGEPIASDTFFQKIQGKYLELFIRLANSPTIPSQLVVPLIERLLEKSHLLFSEVLATIDEALQHIVVNPCEFHACARIYPKLLALFKQIHQEGNWECYEENLTPLLESLEQVKWNTREVFSANFPLIKREAFASVSFQQIRTLMAVFKEAKTYFPEASWAKKGEQKAISYYLEMLTQAIKKLNQFKRQGLQPERLRRNVLEKNELVIELITTLFSLKPAFPKVWIQKHLHPLCKTNISSIFDSELIFYMKGDLLLIGRREQINILDPQLKRAPKEILKYPPQFPSPPNGSFVRSLCVKKLPASPLTKNK